MQQSIEIHHHRHRRLYWVLYEKEEERITWRKTIEIKLTIQETSAVTCSAGWRHSGATFETTPSLLGCVGIFTLFWDSNHFPRTVLPLEDATENVVLRKKCPSFRVRICGSLWPDDAGCYCWSTRNWTDMFCHSCGFFWNPELVPSVLVARGEDLGPDKMLVLFSSMDWNETIWFKICVWDGKTEFSFRTQFL